MESKGSPLGEVSLLYRWTEPQLFLNTIIKVGRRRNGLLKQDWKGKFKLHPLEYENRNKIDMMMGEL